MATLAVAAPGSLPESCVGRRARQNRCVLSRSNRVLKKNEIKLCYGILMMH